MKIASMALIPLGAVIAVCSWIFSIFTESNDVVVHYHVDLRPAIIGTIVAFLLFALGIIFLAYSLKAKK